jgi:hypothetical protein
MSKKIVMISNSMQAEAAAYGMVLDIIHPESSREYVKKIDTAQVFAF